MLARTEQEIKKYWKGSLSSPVVSICCIAYNHENFISEAMDSFLMQETSFPFEIVICEDCSSDGTLEIIKKYEKKFPTIVNLIVSKYNGGMNKNFDRVLGVAEGKYIALCEGDDYWIDPEKLQKQVGFLNENLDYYLVAGKNLKRNGNDLIPFDSRWNKKTTDFDVKDYICKLFFHTSTICCRNYNSKRILTPDYELMQRDQHFVLFQSRPDCNKIKFLEEFLSVYRMHPDGITKTPAHNNLNSSVNSHVAILREFNQYSEGVYQKAIEYRIREFEILRDIYNEKVIGRKILKGGKHINILIKYYLRIKLGLRPF